MRSIFFTLFLFFTVSVFAFDLSDLVEPKIVSGDYYQCDRDSSVKSTVLSDALNKCSQVYVNNTTGGLSYKTISESTTYRKISITLDETYCIYDNTGTCIEEKNRTTSADVRVQLIRGDEHKTCPPDEHPEHKHFYTDENGKEWCAKAIENNCPEETDSDVLVQTLFNNKDICYDNPDGSRCTITTNDTGEYYKPISYAEVNQEPVDCNSDPEPDPEPEPEPDPDEIPDPDEPTPDDNSQGDDSDKEVEIDALNQVNDNLTTINDSINKSSDENSKRLNSIKDNIDNSNKYLKQIKDGIGELKDKPETKIDLKKLEEYTKTTADALTEEPSQQFKDFTPTPAMTSFWTTEYEDGIAGVWEEKNGQLQDTSMFTFLDQFVINGAGQSPAMNIDFSHINLGRAAFELDNRIYGFLSVFFLASAAFACRKIIFGG